MQRLWPEHQVDPTGSRSDALTLLTRNAAADADDDVRATLLDGAPFAQQREDLFLRLLAHRAGIDEEHVGIVRLFGGLQAFGLAQDICHAGRVVLIHLATEGLDE